MAPADNQTLSGPPVGQPAAKTNLTPEQAQEKAKRAVEAKKQADEAAQEAHEATFSPEQRAARDARKEADKADAEAKQAQLDLQQARANKVLERKLGRALREGEYARWVSGDHNNMRAENIELASPAILAIEAKTGVHISDEQLEAMEDLSADKLKAYVDGVPGK